jgi:hypothetical protein
MPGNNENDREPFKAIEHAVALRNSACGYHCGSPS